MIVVSNTSPLTNLAAINQFQILSQLYGELYIAKAVWQELNARGQHWPGRDEVANSNWIHKRTIEDDPLAISLQRDLDRGEAETIALGQALNADLLLMDETDGRRIAQRLGLPSVGVLGILLEAKRAQLLEQVLLHVDALRVEAGFYISDDVYQMVQELAGEKPG